MKHHPEDERPLSRGERMWVAVAIVLVAYSTVVSLWSAARTIMAYVIGAKS